MCSAGPKIARLVADEPPPAVYLSSPRICEDWLKGTDIFPTYLYTPVSCMRGLGRFAGSGGHELNHSRGADVISKEGGPAVPREQCLTSLLRNFLGLRPYSLKLILVRSRYIKDPQEVHQAAILAKLQSGKK